MTKKTVEICENDDFKTPQGAHIVQNVSKTFAIAFLREGMDKHSENAKTLIEGLKSGKYEIIEYLEKVN